ncbi:hypothetical protein A0H81_09635 [Grifola frondosa]|uniref:Uncharacterized protein n=1 Tax=Grifola frondosa TaxID=5627 RepID=A0A1C7M1H5_GRIFR|nr:hypothetical protein A0H81_09635 [Grifola frondosa]
MPTRENCVRLESLLEAAAALVEMKKVVDKVDQDIKVMNMRLEHLREGDGAEGGRRCGEYEEHKKSQTDAEIHVYLFCGYLYDRAQ